MRNTIHCITGTILNSAKISKAIRRLTALCDESGEQIIRELLDYETLPYIDLLIKTGMDQDELKDRLGEMVDSGVLHLSSPYYQPEYELNIPKLNRVMHLAHILAQ